MRKLLPGLACFVSFVTLWKRIGGGADDVQDTHDQIQKRILKLFGQRGWIAKEDAQDMLLWKHSGFSLNASVRIEAWDREGLERLIRYCARPPFASENLKWNRELLVYWLPKPTEGLQSIQLSVLEFFDKVAALIPPPRRHLHHYHGVFAPNAPLRKRIVVQANKFLEEQVSLPLHKWKVNRKKALIHGQSF